MANVVEGYRIYGCLVNCFVYLQASGSSEIDKPAANIGLGCLALESRKVICQLNFWRGVIPIFKGNN